MADISHQLKTPITSMMIMADLLEEAEPGKQEEFIHNIQVSLNKMEWLVGALLKMAGMFRHQGLSSFLIGIMTEPVTM